MFANYFWIICWSISVFLANTLTHAAPNVVFVLADDMGWNDLSYHGSDQIQTPNIDALAYDGVIMKQYYSEPICTPSRTAMLTGKYPMRLGMQGFPLYNSEDRGIPTSERLLPAYLKDLGYATHLVGKWHVGMSKREYLPTSRGYDTHYGNRGGFIDFYTHNLDETWPNGRTVFGLDFFENNVPEESERYIIDALTDRAVNIIKGHNKSKPLFLHVNHNTPHAANSGAYLQPPLFSKIKNQHIANSNRRLYAEMVNGLDESVAQIVKALAKRRMLDDTIIIFASDNGAPTIGMYSNWGVNLPFRGLKNTPWEGAVRVPALIWHSSLKPRVYNGLMHVTDWFPTLIAAAGGQVNTSIDGINQWDSIVQGGESTRNEVLITVYDSVGALNYAAFRFNDYKIILGNIAGLPNTYYGRQLLANKGTPPNYLQSMKSCAVTKILKKMGHDFDKDKIMNTRRLMLITEENNTTSMLCEPTPSRGCLYNIRTDPTESHDLWDESNDIANTLEIKLRDLWAMQVKRGPLVLYDQADPVYFNYTWTPWVI